MGSFLEAFIMEEQKIKQDSIFIGAMSEAVDHLIDVITLKSLDQGRVGIW